MVQDQKKGVLQVAFSDNRPFIYRNDDGAITGIEYELLVDFVEYLEENHELYLEIEWLETPNFESLYDSLRYTQAPMVGVGGLSITDDRKDEINFTKSFLPDIEIIVSSRNFPAAASLKEFTKLLKTGTALSVQSSTFEKNIQDLKENYYPDIKVRNVDRVDVIIDLISRSDDLWGYVSLPSYLLNYRTDQSIVRQRFFTVENEGVAVGGSKSSDWHIPFNEYLKTVRYKNRLNELINTYLGPTFYKVVWSISEASADSTTSKATREVGMLTLENELQAMQLSRNELELKNQNLILTSVIVGSVFLLLLLVVLFLMFRLKSDTNKKLSEKNERIRLQSIHLQESYENLKLLSAIGQEIASSLSVEVINEKIFRGLNGFLDIGVFGIGLYNESENALEFPGVMERGQKLHHFSYDLSDETRLGVLCFNQGKEIVIQDLEKEYRSYLKVLPATKQGEQAESIIYVPLIQGEKKIGVLTVQSFNKNAFTEYQVDIVRNIANLSKAALENASAYETISKQTEVLENAYEEIQRNAHYIENQNEELLSLNQEKNELLEIVAHDLKNPLASALTITDLFRAEDDLSEEHREYLHHIRKSLSRMNDLISKILGIKELEAKTIEPQFEDLNLAYILEEAVDELKVQADQKDIKIETELLPVKVSIDPNFSLEVFENLISNAIKFSEVGSQVSVRMKENGKKCFVEVSDNGPGLTEEDKAKLFGKFQKLSAKPTAGESSTGLGLSIVKKYVESMGGTIACESEYGYGAKFVVTFDKLV